MLVLKRDVPRKLAWTHAESGVLPVIFSFSSGLSDFVAKSSYFTWIVSVA